MPFELQPRRYDDPDVQRMTTDVQAMYVERYGGPDAASVDATEFLPPAGRFFVGLLDGVAVAMGGWRVLPDGRAEIKRMYVSAAVRRRGLARRLLAELERSAVEAGIEQVVLNTGPEQPEAIAMYEAAGYQRIKGFGHYACEPSAVFFGKALPRAAPAKQLSRG